jgi:hypothetical protein
MTVARVRCPTPVRIVLVAVALISSATTDAGAATTGPKTLAFTGYS